MQIKIKEVAEIGKIGRAIRKNQSLDQATAGAFAGSGKNFVSQFEGGKPTVELGRVFELLNQLGVEMVLDFELPASAIERGLLSQELSKLGFEVK